MTADQTIKAVAVDSGGNVSGEFSQPYQVAPLEEGQQADGAPYAEPDPVDETPTRRGPENGPPLSIPEQGILHEPIAFPSRDFVPLEGYKPNTDYTIAVPTTASPRSTRMV